MTNYRQRLTVIVVPQTGKRTMTFQLAPIWLLAVSAVALTLVVGLGILWSMNRGLRSSLADHEEVQRVNYSQQLQIDEMTTKAIQAQVKLEQLERLEKQILELTSKSSAVPSANSGVQSAKAPSPGGEGVRHGGPSDGDLPILSNMIPPDVKSLLFSRRTVQSEPLFNASTAGAIDHAKAVSAMMTANLETMAQSADVLTKGKEAIAKQLEYLAHVPAGLPVAGAEWTDRFGWRPNPFGWGTQFHRGLDLAANYDSPVVATAEGVVVQAGWKAGGFGYTVTIDHAYGLETVYAHLNDWNLKVGTKVKRGDLVGWVGSTGNSTGPHVHYEVHLDGVPVDPAAYIQ